MTTCAFIGSENVRLYYCADASDKSDLSQTTEWKLFPFTGENLASTVVVESDQKLGSAYIGGLDRIPKLGTAATVSQEFSFHHSFFNCLQNFFGLAIQNSTSLQLLSANAPFALLKIVDRGTEQDYYLFRYCNVQSISIAINSGLITVDYEFAVGYLGNWTQDSPHYLSQVAGSLDSAIENWVFNEDFEYNPQSIHSVTGFSLTDNTRNETISSTPIQLTVQIAKNKNAYNPLGSKVHYIPYFFTETSLEISGDFYFTDSSIQTLVLNQTTMTAQLDFEDESGQELRLELPSALISSYADPVAGSAEDDVVIPLSFSARLNDSDEFASLTYTPAP